VIELGGARRALVMAVLNVTPDSFSDGGLFADAESAVRHGLELVADGADLLDVGGESTRPGSEPVPPEEQLRRVLPVITALRARTEVPISIDTTSALVARRAIEAGARVLNDVSALREDPEMASVAAESGAPVVLMHMLGRPRDMQANPVYRDVCAEVRDFLAARVEFAAGRGVARGQIIVDPGFGFGKTFEHNLELLRGLATLKELGRPVLAGTSRKAMLGRILDVPPRERLHGTLATVAAALERGAEIVRVHDPRPALHVVKVMAALQGRNWQ
jgi:dihydropteroate synthase